MDRQERQEIQFAVVRKGSEIVTVGLSQILQPEIRFSGGTIKWLDDELYRKKADNRS